MIIEKLVLPDTVERYQSRSNELIKTIELINSYEPYLRIKYYDVMIHSISLLLQYTILIKENTI